MSALADIAKGFEQEDAQHLLKVAERISGKMKTRSIAAEYAIHGIPAPEGALSNAHLELWLNEIDTISAAIRARARSAGEVNQ